MIRPIVWSTAALDDLDGAIAYIAARNPRAARRLLATIDKTVEGLAEMPTGRPGRVPKTHERVVLGTPYVIAYALSPQDDGREAIVILRIVHGARNWPPETWPD